MFSKSLLVIFVLSFSLSSAGQSLFELNYHFNLKKGREDYKALILRNSDGTGLIRLSYRDLLTGSDNLVEMDMQESFGEDENGKEDTSILIYVGLDPVLKKGKVFYDPDNYVFRLGDDGYYEPAFVLSINEDGTEDVGELDNVRLLNQEDLTEDFVLQYYSQEDDFYKNLFETSVRSLTSSEKQTKMFLVLVANTNDKKIGKTCAIDKESTQKTFGEVAEFLGIGFVPTIIEGNSFSKANVEKAINTLKPSPNDIVIFYYSGHGFSDKRDNYRFPYMDLRDKSFQAFGGAYTMNLEAVFQKIKTKGARLNLVLGDCCNNDPTDANNISMETPSTRTSSIGWDKNKCLELFMNPKPASILMTAAQKGELSAGNGTDGGFFTFNFRESLEKQIGLFDKNSSTTWEKILEASRLQTIERANRTMCRQPDESLKICVQHPVAKLEK